MAERQAGTKAGPPDSILLRLRDFIYEACGIFMPDKMLYFLEERCARRVEARRAGTLRDYFNMLTAGPEPDNEIRDLLNEVAIGDTCFFRSKPQLDALSKVVLPKILEAKAKFSIFTIRLWSCGCSTGEEPYTLAMLLLEDSTLRLKDWSWEIHATDLNDNSLGKAKNGVYDKYALRNTPPRFQARFFERRGERFAIAEEVKQRVNFSRLNLRDESETRRMKENDVIFCSNVLIYFDTHSKKRVVRHIYESLRPGGYFFLGNAESLYGVDEGFHLVHFPGAMAYLRPSQAINGDGLK